METRSRHRSSKNRDKELLEASENSDLKLVKKLIREGADVNFFDDVDRITPLFYALYNEDIEMIQFLLDSGADTEFIDSEGYTPLRWIVEFQNKEIFDLLIATGANIHYDGETGNTLLNMAIGTDIAFELIDRGVDINKTDSLGETPLSLAAERGDLEMVKLLISKGANVNPSPDKDRQCTPLLYALDRGYFDIAKYLINRGARVNGKARWTPLAMAVYSGNVDIVNFLIEKGADINERNENGKGESPLDIAVRVGKDDVLKLLIKKGANIRSENSQGYTSLVFASIDENIEAIRILTDALEILHRKEEKKRGKYEEGEETAELGYFREEEGGRRRRKIYEEEEILY